MTSFAIYSMGCKVNAYESACLRRLLIDSGFCECPDTPDVLIVNSCTVTAESDKKLFRLLRRLRRERPEAVIVLTGCFPQAFPEKSALNEADIVLGNTNRDKLPALLQEYFAASPHEKLLRIQPHEPHEPFSPLSFFPPSAGKTRASLKIQDGCDNFCSYCIIPHSRGRIRSLSSDLIASHAHELSLLGFRELVLTGINLSAYGRDLGGITLADAVHNAALPDGIHRVRLGSLEAEELTPSVIDSIAAEPKLCPHFHISLQSGSSAVLRAMNRKYDADGYIKLCAHIKNLLPDAAITTDVIAGFPTETDDDLEQTISLARQVGFADIHVFPFSPREGTPAARLPQLPRHIITERAARLEKLADELKEQRLSSLVGKTVEVLFEHENSDIFHRGHTPDYAEVYVKRSDSKKSLQNNIICVKIEAYDKNAVYGDLL